MSLPFTITLNRETEDAIKRLKNPQALLAAAMTPQLQALGVHLASKTKERTPADTGTLRNSTRWSVFPESLSLLIFNVKKYAIYVHHGTVHRKMPPVSALLEWARRRSANLRIAAAVASGKNVKSVPKNTKGDHDAAKSLAFLVARSILRRGGLKARPFMADTLSAERAIIVGAVRRGEAAFVRALAGH